MTLATQYEMEFSISYFDFNDFKKLNDSLGHMAGDIALKNVTQIIEEEKRTDDVVARYNGEERVLFWKLT